MIGDPGMVAEFEWSHHRGTVSVREVDDFRILGPDAVYAGENPLQVARNLYRARRQTNGDFFRRLRRPPASIV
jgi:hypothetical protein